MLDNTIKDKLQSIRLLILDVDGVLTNGQFFLGPNGEEYKAFHAQDGYGLKQLQRHGITIAVISGRNSQSVERRMQELAINHVYQGIRNKWPVLEKILKEEKLTHSQCAYVGDDLPDLAIMEKVSLACAVANATPSIQAMAHIQTQRRGGEGAVREICDLILQHQEIATTHE